MNEKESNYALPALPNLPPLQLNMPPLPAPLANCNLEAYDYAHTQYAAAPVPFTTSPLQSPMQLHSQMPPQFHAPFHLNTAPFIPSRSSSTNYPLSPTANSMFHHHDDNNKFKRYPHSHCSNVQIYDINPDVVSESSSSSSSSSSASSIAACANSSHYSYERDASCYTAQHLDHGHQSHHDHHHHHHQALPHAFAAEYVPVADRIRSQQHLFDAHTRNNNHVQHSMCNIKRDRDDHDSLQMQPMPPIVCNSALSVSPKQEEVEVAEISMDTKSHIKKRKKKRNNAKKEEDDDADSNKKKETAKKAKKGQRHICSECSKEFKYKSHLQRHMASHSKSKPFQCQTCGKSFGHQYYLQDHIRYNHVKDARADRKHICSVCTKTFRLKINLTNHLRIHTGEKPFKCGNCHKAFTQKGNCDAHYRACIGIKPFVCTTCSKTFTRKMYLQQHERTHTGVKPFKCEFCEKSFAIKSNMVKHKKARHKAEHAKQK